jgi:hypothetical protein
MLVHTAIQVGEGSRARVWLCSTEECFKLIAAKVVVRKKSDNSHTLAL